MGPAASRGRSRVSITTTDSLLIMSESSAGVMRTFSLMRGSWGLSGGVGPGVWWRRGAGGAGASAAYLVRHVGEHLLELLDGGRDDGDEIGFTQPALGGGIGDVAASA